MARAASRQAVGKFSREFSLIKTEIYHAEDGRIIVEDKLPTLNDN